MIGPRRFTYSPLRQWAPSAIFLSFTLLNFFLSDHEKAQTNGNLETLYLLIAGNVAIALFVACTYGQVVIFEDRVEWRSLGVRIKQISLADITAIEKRKETAMAGRPYLYTLRTPNKTLKFYSLIRDLDDLLGFIHSKTGLAIP